jgi:alpha-L-fucosidase
VAPAASLPLRFAACLAAAAVVAVLAAGAESATRPAGRLGLFIHYGPSTLLNAAGEQAWIDGIQSPDYVNTVAAFAPSADAPANWVALAERIGATSITFTVKHHDGYLLWSSDVPVDRSAGANGIRWGVTGDDDVLAALARACLAAHISLYLYYSLADWYEHDYRVGNALGHLAVEEAQLRELLTRYGPIGGVWIDGAWSTTHTSDFWHLDELEQLIHSLQPRAQIGVNRFPARIAAGEQFEIFEKTLPVARTSWPTQGVFPIGDTWFYSVRSAVKSAATLRSMAARAARVGAALILDLPPRGDGSIDPAYQEVLVTAFPRARR